jgi:hypothetical protein
MTLALSKQYSKPTELITLEHFCGCKSSYFRFSRQEKYRSVLNFFGLFTLRFGSILICINAKQGGIGIK